MKLYFYYFTTKCLIAMDITSEASLSEKYDEYQLRQMEEICIQVDEYDNVVGPIQKIDCHLNNNIKKGIMHRAFSIILFNEKNDVC